MNEEEKGLSKEWTDLELAGFLRLLFEDRELPEASPEVIAYIERVSKKVSGEDSHAARVVEQGNEYGVKLAVVFERLRAAQPRPVRPFGSHLMAKRLQAKCEARFVASMLNEDVTRLEAIESRSINPLDLGPERIARIAVVFGICMSELRSSLRLDAAQSRSRLGGPAFARSHATSLKSEAMLLATEDLLLGDKPIDVKLDAKMTETIDRTLCVVREALEKNGRRELVDC